MEIKKYIVEIDSINPSARRGTVLYTCTKYDYGSARTDTALLKRECISVTKSADGDYPFLILPLDILREVENEYSKS